MKRYAVIAALLTAIALSWAVVAFGVGESTQTYTYTIPPTSTVATLAIPEQTFTQTVTVPTTTQTVTVTTTAPGTTTAPPTTTATPPPSGSILFTGDFETGNSSQWNWGAQCAPMQDASFNRGTLNISKTYAQQGIYGARITLAKDGSKPQACEVLEHRPLVIDSYYGMVVKVVSGTTNSWGTATAQFEYQGITGPPEGLFIENSTTTSEAAPNAMLMAIQTGHCLQGGPCDTVGSRYDTTGGVTTRQYAIPPGAFVVGTAYEVICHIHFAFDTTGIFECWYRVKGTSAYVLGGRYDGVPTVQWTSTPHMQPEDVTKIGAYRPNDSSSTWVVDHDGFVIGTTFEVVAAALP